MRCEGVRDDTGACEGVRSDIGACEGVCSGIGACKGVMGEGGAAGEGVRFGGLGSCAFLSFLAGGRFGTEAQEGAGGRGGGGRGGAGEGGRGGKGRRRTFRSFRRRYFGRRVRRSRVADEQKLQVSSGVLPDNVVRELSGHVSNRPAGKVRGESLHAN